MKEAKDKSKNQGGVALLVDVDATSKFLKDGVMATDDSFKYLRYKDHETELKAVHTLLESGDNQALILASTSFYAEQTFDTGVIEGSFGTFEVCNVQTVKGFVFHIGSLSSKTGKVLVGDKVTCKVDYERRKLIAPNHTCTHMLNFALKKILGDDIKQEGSIVLPEKLRFDLIKAKLALLQNQVRIAEQNLTKAVRVATEAAESATSDGKTFCVVKVDVGLDLVAVRAAVLEVMEKKASLLSYNASLLNSYKWKLES